MRWQAGRQAGRGRKGEGEGKAGVKQKRTHQLGNPWATYQGSFEGDRGEAGGNRCRGSTSKLHWSGSRRPSGAPWVRCVSLSRKLGAFSSESSWLQLSDCYVPSTSQAHLLATEARSLGVEPVGFQHWRHRRGRPPTWRRSKIADTGKIRCKSSAARARRAVVVVVLSLSRSSSSYLQK